MIPVYRGESEAVFEKDSIMERAYSTAEEPVGAAKTEEAAPATKAMVMKDVLRMTMRFRRVLLS